MGTQGVTELLCFLPSLNVVALHTTKLQVQAVLSKLDAFFFFFKSSECVITSALFSRCPDKLLCTQLLLLAPGCLRGLLLLGSCAAKAAIPEQPGEHSPLAS